MTRTFTLGALLAIGTISLAAYQQPQSAGPKVVEAQKIKDNLYMLTGKGGGGNTAVYIGAAGVTVVDAKNPGWGQPILDKIKELTPKPVTLLINTHTHGDHVSGNVEFPATVDVVVQENTKTNMEKMDIFKQNNGKGMPKKTFKDTMTLGSGKDRVDLYYFGRGHTNGDAWIVFPDLRVAHAGDIFSGKNLPLLDMNNGGSGLDIARELEARAGRTVSRGALYTSLDRLEDKGLVRWKVVPGTPERNNLPRRLYTVTAAGLAALRASRDTLRRMWRGLDDILKEPTS